MSSFPYRQPTPSPTFNPDQYLIQVLRRQAVPTGDNSPAVKALKVLNPIIRQWAHRYLGSVFASGSYAKGTAVNSGTDIDLFISLKHDTPATLEDIYWSLFNFLKANGFDPRPQNVSIGIRLGSVDIDLIPGRRQGILGGDHSLWVRKQNTWKQTNVQRHFAYVKLYNRLPETRLIKIWRNQWGLDFPSFYLEMSVIEAMKGSAVVTPSKRVIRVMEFLRDDFTTTRFVDPANSNNIISDDLNATERKIIADAADRVLRGNWHDFVK